MTSKERQELIRDGRELKGKIIGLRLTVELEGALKAISLLRSFLKQRIDLCTACVRRGTACHQCEEADQTLQSTKEYE